MTGLLIDELFQVLPQWMKKNHDIKLTCASESTCVPELDQIIKVLFETSMFVGGFLGFLLDNTIPGTREERGLVAWEAQHRTQQQDGDSGDLATYDIPYISSLKIDHVNIGQFQLPYIGANVKNASEKLSNHRWARYVPFLPTFSVKLRKTTKV